MKSNDQTRSIRKVFGALVAALGLALSPMLPVQAEVADLSDVPLANSPSDTVRPNLMYILDDSGSMLWDYMPDNVQKTTTGYTANNCKTCTSSSCTIDGDQCALGNSGSTDGATADWGEPPYFSAQFNQIYYNPDITYSPGLTSAGASLGNISALAAPKDKYFAIGYNFAITGAPATAPNVYVCNIASPTATNLGQSSKCQAAKNLTTTYPEIYYCNTSTPAAADLTDTTKCKRNGINNVSGGYFNYFSNDPTSGGYPIQTGTASTSFNNRIVRNTGNPYYFKITPNEYCSDSNLTLCQLANADGSAPSGFTIPANVRYCKTTTDSSATTAVSGSSGGNVRCQKKFDQSNYPYPRYGRFTRVDIVSTTTSYPKAATAVRTDCASATACTYAEELQNFANWYSYYRTRMQTMKTATGRAFLQVDDRYRVGFITINPNNPVTSSKYLALNTFDATQKSAWYTLLYQQTNNGSTPLRQALSRVGRHYANVQTGINDGMGTTDPIQYSCQQNFALLTTDGYYNDSATDAVKLTDTSPANQVGNQDNVEDTVDPKYTSRAGGTLDGNGQQSTVATPSVTTEQVKCVGNAATAFSGSPQRTGGCGCTGVQTRIWQRDNTVTTTVTLLEGSQTGSSTATTTTFTDVTQTANPSVAANGCQTPLQVTTVVRSDRDEDAFCQDNANATFTASPAGTIACGCSTGQHRILTRRVSFNTTTITTDGVAGTPTVSANTLTYKSASSSFAATPAANTDCTASVIQVDTRVDTSTEQAICTWNGTASFASFGQTITCNTTQFPSLSPVPAAGTRAVILATRSQNYSRTTTNGVAGGFVLGSTTYAYAVVGSFAPPLIRTETYTVTATQTRACTQSTLSPLVPVTGFTIGANANSNIANCGCSVAGRRTAWQRTARATYTKTFTDGVLTNTSALSAYTTVSDVATVAVPTCTTSSQSNVAVSANGTSTPSGGALTSTVDNSASGGVTKVITQSPNPSAITTGTVALGTATGTALTITRSPNPSAVTTTTTSTTDNSATGGINLVRSVTNPTTVGGTSTTTVTAGGTANTLADVAMYYYKTDLRPCPGGTPANGVCLTDAKATDNVPNTSKDFAITQHMTTFTLGLGLQGLMDYTADYETNSSSDLGKIKSASTGCSFSTGVCDWPTPTAGQPSTLDDLWHAAVNGRGVYYSASDPNSLADGLSSALAALNIQTAAASASATSSPNITQTDNYIFSSTFRTVKWDGEVVAQRIDTTTGAVIPAIVWSAQDQLDAKVTASSDTRVIYKFDPLATSKLSSFTFANLTSAAASGIAAEQPYFTNKGSGMSQYGLLASADQTASNSGTNLVNYLRGWTGLQGSAFRARDHVLGDPVNATPAFVKAPTFNFIDAVTPTYATFKSSNSTRQGVLYIAANDGMLHAFNGDTGDEMWAYVPRMVMPNMWKLATYNWDVNHTYLVDGSPQIMDVYDNRTTPSTPSWKTILVGGLNKGGRGYYALDITDPSAPKGLWSICNDSTLCEVSDADFGYTYGNPVITKLPTGSTYAGRWVVIVTSGLDNVQTGATGKGFLYVLDAFTGAKLFKVDTGVGSLTTPSGLSKISAFATNFNNDNTALYVYGGDLLGNVWRFDMSTATPTAQQMATLKDSTGKPQSITSRPELGIISGNRVVFVGTGRYLGADDLPDPASLGLGWAYTQSIYALKDRGSAYGNPRTSTPGIVAQTLTDTGTASRTASSNVVNWVAKDGWYVDLNPGGSSPGERVNLDPQLIQGTLLVVSNVPNNTACTVGGDSFTYQFDYSTGKAVSSSAGGVVGTKTLGQITVGVVVFRRPSGVFTGVNTGATGVKTPFGVNVGGTGSSGRRISYRELVR